MKFTQLTFTQIVIAATLSAASLTLSIPRTLADSPAINVTEYELESNTLQQCVRDAEDVMKEENFPDIHVSKSDVFGTTDNTSVELYCVRDGKTMMMIIAGQNNEEAEKLQNALQKRFAP